MLKVGVSDKIQLGDKMLISKTVFKEYTRCPRVAALDSLYMKKLQTEASIFSDDKADYIELLSSMFDVVTGDDLVDQIDPQYEALLPFYNQLEAYAMQVAKAKFGNNIIHNPDTKKQKYFTYRDGLHDYITYLDGYQELHDEVRVFEVKATSVKKFRDIGVTIDKVHHSLFTTCDNVLSLKIKHNIPLDKYNQNYQKLFNRFHDAGKYVFDLAVERFIIERSIKNDKSYQNKKFSYYLVVLNTDYTYDGTLDENNNYLYLTDKDGNELVTFIDLTQVTKEYQEQINLLNEQLLKHLERLSLDEVKVGSFCERKSQAKCAFIKTCWAKALEKGSILEYINHYLGFKDETGKVNHTIDLINNGYLKMDDVPLSWLERTNNLIQRQCYENNTEYINKEKIKKGIETLQYPLYYLDFESFPCPLPRFVGEHPYNQSVFQFSLHIEKRIGECDKDLDNYYYLAKDSNDHRLELVQKLITYIDLSQGGTVIVYNKSFEHTRIKEFCYLYPQYKGKLQQINDHMFDLLDLLFYNKDFYLKLGFDLETSKTINYYHNDLQGSYSIKKVLPLFSDLTYKGLNVRNGTEAIAAYARFKTLEPEDLEAVQKDLIEYCKQDTYAMVLVLWKLMKKVGY